MLNIIFSVSYYLELRNAINIYLISHFLPTKVNLVVCVKTPLLVAIGVSRPNFGIMGCYIGIIVMLA